LNIPAIVVPIETKSIPEEDDEEEDDPNLPPIKILSHAAAHQQTFTNAMFNTLKPFKTLAKPFPIQKIEEDPMLEDEPFLLAQGLSSKDKDLLVKPAEKQKDEKTLKLGEDYVLVDIAPSSNEFLTSQKKIEEIKSDLVVAVGEVDLSQSGYRIMVGSHSFEAPVKEKKC